MKELLDNIKKIFSKKLTLAVVLVIVAALAIVGAVYLVSLQHRAAWQRICGLCVLALKKS